MKPRTFSAAATALALSLAAIAAPLSAHANDVFLSSAPGDGGQLQDFGGPTGLLEMGEVFTAPVTGMLNSVEFVLASGVTNVNAYLGVWNGAATFTPGAGVSQLLYQSGSSPAPTGGDYTFAPQIGVVAGQQYVAFLSTYMESSTQTGGVETGSTRPPGIDYVVYNTGLPTDTSWDGQPTGTNLLFTASFTPDTTCTDAPSATCVPAGPGGPNGGSGAPEPETWALLIAGFGAAGSVLRRRRVLRAA
ncbi:PEPxxWA-CTERM sorting domain-containing protein [Phenylobacterium sp.]|uniref:PEPxxWA-CTERM sorting domain-containing protein n=1 Tax=Phenylobacterium sp. TaxID=1871053 RepID=UPI0011F8711E|nr:PEPxxWA-CTERM sorting domain-containing protein [Phenylobacterium sp.]THD62385.1 MAG: PEP-CTERM sorting domain-containing protein [Phenylobacterium sp.]